MVRQTTTTRHALRPGSREHLGHAPLDRAAMAAEAVRGLAGAGRTTGSGAVGRKAGRRPGAASWHLAKNVSAEVPEGADLHVLRRHVRFAQRELLWSESSLTRVTTCGRTPVQNGGVMLKQATGDKAYYSGLASCGSIWACPVCSAKIRNRRAEDISKAAANWTDEGNSVVAAAFTVPHNRGHQLKDTFEAVASSFRKIQQGKKWQDLRAELGIMGQIRAVECTYGENGWHPHIHALFFCSARRYVTSEEEYVTSTGKTRTRRTYGYDVGEIDQAGLVKLTLHLRKAWGDAIVAAGFNRPSEIHGVDVQLVASAEEAGAYIAKTQDGKAVGNEVARGDMKLGRKGGRTPFQILDDFRWTGDEDDLRLWHEWEQVTHGRRAIFWSDHLRALLLPDEGEEATDDEIAAEEVGGENVAMIDKITWKGITARPGLACALLDRLESGGLPAVNELLAVHELTQLVPWELVDNPEMADFTM